MPSLSNSAGELEFDILNLKTKRRSGVAQRSVPRRQEGEVVDIGTWTDNSFQIHFTCRLDEADADSMQEIYDAREKTMLVLEFSNKKFEGWLSHLKIVWAGHNKPWLALVDFIVGNISELEKTFETSYAVDAKLVLMPNLWQFREHRREDQGAPQYVQVGFSKNASDLRMQTGSAYYYGNGYLMVTFPKEYVANMKLHVKYYWLGYSWQGNYHHMYIEIWDGEYDRSNDATFPDCADVVYKGNGLLATIKQRDQDTGHNYEETLDIPSLSNSTQDMVTIVFRVFDGQCYGQSNYLDFKLDLMELKYPESGTFYSQDFTSGSVTMERTGTTGDYGKYTP